MEERANNLRAMQVCRFCLDEHGPFTNIYEKDNRDGKHATPLPLQIMACVAIEVFANDGMPQLICNYCRAQTIGAYNFKTLCKQSDDALKLYLATGNLMKPKIKLRSPSNETKVFDAKAKLKPEVGESPVKKIKFEEDPECVPEFAHDEIVLTQEDLDEDSQDIVEEQKDDDDEFEAEVLNPILKVPQVETDIFPCTECERSFPLKQLLDLHMKNHNRERSFGCDECGRRFFTKYDLAKHSQTHSATKPYSCVVCNKQFARESLLHRHEKIHVDVPKYLCGQCDRTFLTREDLDTHAEKHKKKRPFTCRICQKGFVFKQGLERHELTHSDEKPHKCSYCEASFTSAIKLMRHVTSHAGLRPYPCKLCGRTFLLSHHLTRHMRSHYATKSPAVEPVGQHKCDVCSMSFRRKDSLINHSAIHSMVNLKCVICNTAFSSAKQVKDHITSHLAGLPYPCDKCDYSFETQDQLEEHELKHAEMEYEDQIEQEVNKEALETFNQQIVYEDEDFDDDEEDGVTEFTITTGDNEETPQVIRRPRRATKVKSYAQFLKDELGSDIEDEIVSDDKLSEEAASVTKETIQPIVRVEGTKVYQRKHVDKSKQVSAVKVATPKVDDSNINLKSLGITQEVVKDLPNKQYVNMKIGDKTVRVQKLIMSKAEIDAMAKQGKIEQSGDTFIYKKQVVKGIPKSITLDSIIDNPKPSTPKPAITKTYVKKTIQVQSTTPEQVEQTVEESMDTLLSN